MPGETPSLGDKLDAIYCALYTYGTGGGVVGASLTGNQAWTDVVNGDNATAQTGTQALPFLTLTEAQSQAISGDTIMVRPGVYAPSSILGKAGVDWNFVTGARIERTDNTSNPGLFSDNADPMVYNITGDGYFKLSQGVTGLSFGAVIAVNDPLSNIRIECDTIYGTSVAVDEQGIYGMIQGDGIVMITANDIISENTAGNPNSTVGVYWRNGPLHVTARNIICRGDTGTQSPAYLSFVGTAPTGDAYITADYFGSDGSAVIQEKSVQSTAKSWVHAKVIENTDVGTSIYTEGAGRLYVTAQKLIGAMSFASTGAALNYITADKIEPVVNGASGAACMLHAAGTNTISRINVEQWDAGAFTGETIKVTAGTVIITGMQFTGGASTVGIEITGGTLILQNCYINTAANASTNPILKSGGTLKMYNCTLVAEGTRDSISAPTAQNVMACACFTNRAVDADVTITVTGGLSVDADVS
jgi:hypothetical protein